MTGRPPYVLNEPVVGDTVPAAGSPRRYVVSWKGEMRRVTLSTLRRVAKLKDGNSPYLDAEPSRTFFRPVYERAAEGFADELRARVARAFAVPAHMLAERAPCGFCGRRYVEQPVAACDATTAGQCRRRQIRSE